MFKPGDRVVRTRYGIESGTVVIQYATHHFVVLWDSDNRRTITDDTTLVLESIYRTEVYQILNKLD